MRNKKEHFKELESIENMVSHIRTINESIQFGEDFDEEEPMGDFPEGEAAGAADLAKMNAEPDAMPKDEPDPEQGMRELGEVDQIREIALRGMIKLCKNPEDDRYQALKKIFQFCDKAAENKEKEPEA